MTVGDINSDGLNDIIIAAEWTVTPTQGVLSIFYQNWDDTIAPEYVYTNVPTARIIRIADMDHDGHNDLVLATGLKQFTIIKQNLNSSLGVLSSEVTYYDVQTSYWPQYDALELGDVNGDGRTDVVTLDIGNSGNLSIYIQNNLGSLDPPELLTPWFAPPFGIEIVDINSDGLNDICGDRVDPGIPHGIGNVFVLFQTTARHFNTPVGYSFDTLSGGGSGNHESLSIGDVTGDGLPDAVVNWRNEGLYVLPNQFQ